ncbi:MAG: CDP-alcohol phosphatidyltransferase family protein [Lentimicrobium sp.]|jgi:CDP-diacylglycerol--glycerol-3-phosphate 3-phosphatidyltransferase|nr:CDP-alcohol phosphatidyltransferase family protein [Lentimicrobium sp.]MDD2527534.1 CDP-alcohol phosphatidyltransferase family protein [Lentimicrobiaceae bacterium]MDD4596700.1 CDP-alcohol phosphatidyltransferase family protein [Lentimicrobiaceae bacterium]MDY0024933.1 CDP-alcohol phosphatidyltransferase family protein [Lentimicrobium sp.]HAH58389.1 CDP-alcohol phosphatidyltransferase family protein [Bacteroidales bacterium]
MWSIIKKNAYKAITPLVLLLNKTGITPNGITTIGLGLTLISTIVLIAGGEVGNRGDFRYVFWFGAITLFAGMFDMLDGQLARLTNKMTKFGALYDSVLDRYSEMFMFLGICYYLVAHHYFLSSLFAFIAMIGSIMVSYVRARAEALGVECTVGIMQRPERVLTIGIAALLAGVVSYVFGDFKYSVSWLPFPLFENISVFTIPIFILAILTNFTAFQRIYHCNNKM